MKGPTVISFWKGLGIFSRDFFFLEFVQRFFCNFLLGIFLDFWFQFLILFLLGFLQEFPKNYFKNPSVDFSRNFIFILTGISSEITIRIPQGICPRTPVENLREITTGFFQEFMYGFVLLFILFLLGFLQKFPKNCFQESFREFSRNFILNSNRNFVTIYSPGFVMEFPLRFLQFFFRNTPLDFLGFFQKFLTCFLSDTNQRCPPKIVSDISLYIAIDSPLGIFPGNPPEVPLRNTSRILPKIFPGIPPDTSPETVPGISGRVIFTNSRCFVQKFLLGVSRNFSTQKNYRNS